jgi:Rac GTPase-activating protein 1
MKRLIESLPLANRHTLAFIILHLKRIIYSAECKMNVTAMAYVMGPAIVGNSSAHLEAAEIVNEHRIQHLIADALLQMDAMFYEETLMAPVECENEENEAPCKLIKNNPLTPELLRKTKTASVLTSILGPARNSNANLASQKSHLNIFKSKQVTLTPGREQNTRTMRNFQFNTPNF